MDRAVAGSAPPPKPTGTGVPVTELSYDDVEETTPSTPYPRCTVMAKVVGFWRRVFVRRGG